MIKRVVHTGAKSHDGGFQTGLFISRYQVLTAGPVNIEPKKPAERVKTIEAINLKGFFIFIYPV
jgi:hypothetical protein